MYPEPSNIWESIEFSPMGIAIAESTWMFPTFETIHVIALVTVLATIAVVDLRLIGVLPNRIAFSRLSTDMLPWTWIAFGLAAITGALLFISKASYYMVNPFFLVKLGLLAAAGLNMAVFHFVTQNSQTQWDRDAAMPTAARVAGWTSLLLWVGVVVCGRLIGFTLGICLPGDPNPCPIPGLF